MPLRPVPWAIGNGAENSVELARAGVYAGTSGATGIVEPPDFRVTAMPVPGGAVRVLKGTGVIKSTYPGVFGQSYVVQEQSFTDVPVAATGSGGGATKHVYVLVGDTQYGGQNPPSVEDGPYNSYQVTTTLPANQPYLYVAQINQPASTATITGAMIVDKRKVAIPRRENVIFARPRIMDDDDPRQNFVNTPYNGPNGNFYGEAFPGGAGSPNSTDIYVPEWATHQSIRADWIGVRCESGKNTYGHYWVEFGDEYITNGWSGGRNLEYATQVFAFDTTGTQGNYRTSWPLMDQTTVPKKLRGKTVKYQFKAGLYAAADTNGVFMNNLSGMGLELTFSQQAIDEDTL